MVIGFVAVLSLLTEVYVSQLQLVSLFAGLPLNRLAFVVEITRVDGSSLAMTTLGRAWSRALFLGLSALLKFIELHLEPDKFLLEHLIFIRVLNALILRRVDMLHDLLRGAGALLSFLGWPVDNFLKLQFLQLGDSIPLLSFQTLPTARFVTSEIESQRRFFGGAMANESLR